MFNPTFGLIMAVFTFSTHAGHIFKAEFDYINYEQFEYTTPKELDLTTERDTKFHHGLKNAVLKTTKDQTSQEW